MRRFSGCVSATIIPEISRRPIRLSRTAFIPEYFRYSGPSWTTSSGIPPRRTKSRREVHEDAPRPAEGLAVESDLLDGARSGFGVGLRPLRDLVPLGLADRVLAKGVGSLRGIERIEKPLEPPVVHALELVLDARLRGELHDEVPQVRPVEPLELLRGREAIDPVTEVDGLRGTAVDEGGVGPLEQRELVVVDEGVDLLLAGTLVGEPMDREAAIDDLLPVADYHALTE